jgi:PIN like domain
MNFFFDNMMSPKLARMLQIFVDRDHRVSHIHEDERFDGSTEDERWVSELAKDEEGWSVISGDLRMLANPTIVAQLSAYSALKSGSSRKPWSTGIERKIASSRSWSSVCWRVPLSSIKSPRDWSRSMWARSPTWRRICEAR